MSREEAIYCLKSYQPDAPDDMCKRCKYYESIKLAPNVYTCISDKAREMAIQALSQEPCNDAISRQNIIDIYKSCADMLSDEELKGADLVMEWVNNAPPVTLKPIECDDAISRDAALEKMADYVASGYADSAEDFLGYSRIICQLPSVTPQPKTGHWIGHREHCENLGVMPSGLGAYEWCSNCDCGIDVREWYRNNYNYCPNCGCRMFEPQESEE